MRPFSQKVVMFSEKGCVLPAERVRPFPKPGPEGIFEAYFWEKTGLGEWFSKQSGLYRNKGYFFLIGRQTGRFIWYIDGFTDLKGRLNPFCFRFSGPVVRGGINMRFSDGVFWRFVILSIRYDRRRPSPRSLRLRYPGNKESRQHLREIPPCSFIIHEGLVS